MEATYHRRVEVLVASPEEADQAIAEFWAGGEQLGWTHLDDGEVVVHLQPRPDGQPWRIAAHSLFEALATARHRLSEPFA